MIAEKLADELKTTFRLSNGDSGMAWLAVARRAKELLGDKPVATREGVIEFMRGRMWNVEDVLAALTHFAPPRHRMMIEGMTAEEIEREMIKGWEDRYLSTHHAPPDVHLSADIPRPNFLGAAVTIHCLANTPAPEVDPDAGAKKVHALFRAHYRNISNEKFDETSGEWQDACRAVAAMEKDPPA